MERQLARPGAGGQYELLVLPELPVLEPVDVHRVRTQVHREHPAPARVGDHLMCVRVAVRGRVPHQVGGFAELATHDASGTPGTVQSARRPGFPTVTTSRPGPAGSEPV
jgi:hypothetical protein